MQLCFKLVSPIRNTQLTENAQNIMEVCLRSLTKTQEMSGRLLVQYMKVKDRRKGKKCQVSVGSNTYK